MAYEEHVAERVREHLDVLNGFSEKNMFGGLCFLLHGNMLAGIVGETLMLRVGPNQYETCLENEFAREMDFTGKALRGLIYVDPEGFAEEPELMDWLDRALQFVRSLPAK